MISALAVRIMPLSPGLRLAAVIGLLLGLNGWVAEAQTPPSVIASKPVTAPPRASNSPLANSTLAWDSELKSIDAHVDDTEAHLAFNFTNVSQGNVIIVNVAAGCHCTTTKVAPLPWTIAPGSNGQIGVSIDLHGRASMPSTFYKSLTVSTDKGLKILNVRVNILPVVLPQLTDAERALDLKTALANRQAVFQDECSVCHVRPGADKYGKPLYDADCAICHEGEHRAPQVPDLHSLKAATNVEFWRVWIAHGKPGSLMPAFSTTDGGPLNDSQIMTLAQYLNHAIPSKPAAPAAGGQEKTP